MNQEGLVDRIKKAKSVEEINSLLAEGKLYLHASSKTQRKWQRLAGKRISHLATNELTKEKK